MPNITDLKGDLLERLLIIQSLLEQDRRIENIEQKVDRIIKELSILDGAFEEGREERVPPSLEQGDKILGKNTIYLRKLLKILDDLYEGRENR